MNHIIILKRGEIMEVEIPSDDNQEAKRTSKYNVYDLFLILILLILSENILLEVKHLLYKNEFI